MGEPCSHAGCFPFMSAKGPTPSNGSNKQHHVAQPLRSGLTQERDRFHWIFDKLIYYFLIPSDLVNLDEVDRLHIDS